jgi:hypothetical protein
MPIPRWFSMNYYHNVHPDYLLGFDSTSSRLLFHVLGLEQLTPSTRRQNLSGCKGMELVASPLQQ